MEVPPISAYKCEYQDSDNLSIRTDCAVKFGRMDERLQQSEDYQRKNNGAILRMQKDIKQMRNEYNESQQKLLLRVNGFLFAFFLYVGVQVVSHFLLN